MVADANSQLIFRVDAGAAIGSGHLMRCLALAQSWKARGGKVVFITNCREKPLIKRLKGENFTVFEIENSYPHPADLKATREILKNYPQAWCVIDGYHFDAKFQREIRKNGNRALVVDDIAHLPFYDADAILNQNINAADLRYNCPPQTKMLLGTCYALLRREFTEWQTGEREIPETARKILITMGGSDAQNQTLKVLRAVERLEIDNLNVKAVVGISNPHLNELQRAAKISSIRVELIHNAENMPELMAWAESAISAAGSTCWELAFMGLPCVLIVLADNQAGIAAGLNEAGFADNLGWFEEVSENSLAVKLREFLSDSLLRRKMSERGRQIVDGKGAARVIKQLTTTSGIERK